MKKVLFALTSVFILMIGAVFAFQNGMNTEQREQNYNTYHTKMEKIVETGTYADLIKLREEVGMPLAKWIQSEEDFAKWQETHIYNEANGISGQQGPKSNGNHMMNGQRYKNSGQRGQGLNGNCLMSD